MTGLLFNYQFLHMLLLTNISYLCIYVMVTMIYILQCMCFCRCLTSLQLNVNETVLGCAELTF